LNIKIQKKRKFLHNMDKIYLKNFEKQILNSKTIKNKTYTSPQLPI